MLTRDTPVKPSKKPKAKKHVTLLDRVVKVAKRVPAPKPAPHKQAPPPTRTPDPLAKLRGKTFTGNTLKTDGGGVLGAAGDALNAARSVLSGIGKTSGSQYHTPGPIDRAASSQDDDPGAHIALTETPLMKALHQLTRGSSATAGAVLAATKGENVLKGAKEGFLKNDRSWREVAQKAGLHGWVLDLAGLAGDVAFDPVTYATFGLGSAATTAEKTAVRAAARTEAQNIRSALKSAEKRGKTVTPEMAERLERDARERITAVGEKAGHSKSNIRQVRAGVRIAGRTHDVPVTPASTLLAKVGRRTGQATADLRAPLSPRAIPKDMTRVEHEALRTDIRESQAVATVTRNKAFRLAQAIKHATKGDENRMRGLVYAMERGDHTTLPPAERVVADRLTKQYADIRSAFSDHGIDITLRDMVADPKALDLVHAELQTPDGRNLFDEIRGEAEKPMPYVTRMSKREEQRLATGDETGIRVTGRSQAPMPSERTRVFRGPREEEDIAHPGMYSDNQPLIHALYGDRSARRLQNLDLLRRVMARYAHAPTVDALEHGVAWKLDGKRYVQITDRRAAQKMIEDGDTHNLIVLPEPVSREITPVISSPVDSNQFLRGLDKFTRGWKMANTILRPGFYVNTALGNTWQLYLRDALFTRDWAVGAKAWAAMRASERVDARIGGRSFAHFVDRAMRNRTVTINGAPVRLGTLAEEAIEHGAVRIGSRAIDPLDMAASKQAARVTRRSPIRAAGNVAEDMDDITKLILYVRARRGGMLPREATAHTFTGMIDYSDLTKFERTVMRRLMPFYVYTTRNLPLQIKGLAARPGKAANLEKIREYLADQAGLPDGWQGKLLRKADQDRIQFPVPGVKVDGRQFFTDLRLPVSDMARPFSIAGPLVGGSGDDTWRGLQRYLADLNPVIKGGTELVSGHRFDYDRPITQPVNAGHIEGALGKLLGVLNQDRDPRTGKVVNQIPGRLDHVLRLLGGSYGAAALNQGRAGATSGIDPATKALGSLLGGVGISAPYPEDVIRERGGQMLTDLNARRDREFRLHGHTELYYKLGDQYDAIKRQVDEAKARLGYPREKEKIAESKDKDVSKAMGLSTEKKSPADRAAQYELERVMKTMGLGGG